jgi:hypothetical protein
MRKEKTRSKNRTISGEKSGRFRFDLELREHLLTYFDWRTARFEEKATDLDSGTIPRISQSKTLIQPMQITGNIAQESNNTFLESR